jgi:hypothetical protein
MKRLLGLSVVALFVSALSLTAQDNPLYPLKVGSKWTYKVSGGSIEVKVEKKEQFGGKDCFKLETTAQGKVSASEHVVVEADGVYRTGVNGLKPDAPIKFLALPATKDTKWTVNTKVQQQEVSGEFQIKEEDVTVPLGTYKAATVVNGPNFKIANMDTSIKMWFAKDVGLVKLEFKLGGQDATLELEKYEPGK